MSAHVKYRLASALCKPPSIKKGKQFPEEYRDYSLEEDLGKH
jgi:hypothetical protein